MYLQFRGARPADEQYGVTNNPCWPSTLINDPGFTLWSDDPWYTYNQAIQTRDEVSLGLYEQPPGAEYTNGKVNRPGFNKRSLDAAELSFNDGNGTRQLSDEDIAAELGIEMCAEEGCALEIDLAYALSPSIRRERSGHPSRTAAHTTTSDEAGGATQAAARAASVAQAVWQISHVAPSAFNVQYVSLVQ